MERAYSATPVRRCKRKSDSALGDQPTRRPLCCEANSEARGPFNSHGDRDYVDSEPYCSGVKLGAARGFFLVPFISELHAFLHFIPRL